MSSNAEHAQAIVVGIDGSRFSTSALLWAMRQAGLTGARVRAVAVWQHRTLFLAPAAPPAALLLPDLEQDAAAMLAQTVEDAGRDAPEVAVEQLVVEGSAVPVLLEQARSASLLVVGSRGRGAFTGMLLGSVSSHCVQLAACPVVVVPPTSTS
jgi:nucleotide-binding universal stress UspA family protein